MPRTLVALAAALMPALTHAAFDKGLATVMVNFARAAYCNKDAIEAWSCDACSQLPGVTKATYLTNADLDTAGYVAVDGNGTITVSFRGSSNLLNCASRRARARVRWS